MRKFVKVLLVNDYGFSLVARNCNCSHCAMGRTGVGMKYDVFRVSYKVAPEVGLASPVSASLRHEPKGFIPKDWRSRASPDDKAVWLLR